MVLVMTEKEQFSQKDDLHHFAPEQILLKTLFRPEVKADQVGYGLTHILGTVTRQVGLA